MKLNLGVRTALIASLLAAAVAMPAFGDTLILRNGTRYSGTLVNANPRTITFRDLRGHRHRYSVNDVEAVRFGDVPDRFNGQEHRDDQGHGRQDNPGNGNDQRNQYQDNSGYDQAALERVVIPAGTEVDVRTNERIDSRDVVEGQTFSAQINEDVRDQNGSVVIPRGSDVRLITRRLEANGDITLDMESISVAGRRYRVSTADQELQNRRDGIGGNKRTGEFVGGGAVLGAVIGAIAGGGRGAAIGAASGAGAGAATQIITQGKEVHVPAESVIRFRLDRNLRLHLWS
ncbi:MAG: hypothetical protein WCE61_20980 [Candidatus Acidiferrum sp.]